MKLLSSAAEESEGIERNTEKWKLSAINTVEKKPISEICLKKLNVEENEENWPNVKAMK